MNRELNQVKSSKISYCFCLAFNAQLIDTTIYASVIAELSIRWKLLLKRINLPVMTSLKVTC